MHGDGILIINLVENKIQIVVSDVHYIHLLHSFYTG
jgi:hypothetical protein